MIKNDKWIAQRAKQGMISPFEPQLIRKVELTESQGTNLRPVISYGLSSYGYDIRLSPSEFRLFQHVPGTVIDPKQFNADNLRPATLHSDRTPIGHRLKSGAGD